MTDVKKLITLPVWADEYGYILDDDNRMVADNWIDDHGPKLLAACAAALNNANGELLAEQAKPIFVAAGIKLPVKAGGELGLEITDATGRHVLRVRGWGRLQYLGQDEGIRAQETIAAAFVEALNRLAD